MILILGHSPAKNRESQPPIFNGCQTGNRLTRILQRTNLQFEFKAFNLFNSKGEVNDLDYTKFEGILTLGKEVGKYIDSLNLSVNHLNMPHPSGRNRFWNNTGAEEQISLQLREFIISIDYSVSN